MSNLTIERRVEWLSDFQSARREAGYALAAISEQVRILYQAGLNGVAATLVEPLQLAEESVAAMDTAVGRMISEDAQASFDQVGETLHALLQTACGK